MRYYPVFLDIRGKRCLVVGGGEVATRKMETLLRGGARVEVLTKTLSGFIREKFPKEVTKLVVSRNLLERNTLEGNGPVGENKPIF